MLILDANILSATFDPTHSRHHAYVPVREFVLTARGYIVSGGTKYLKELALMPNILGLIKNLEQAGQVKVFSAKRVDAEENRVELLTAGTKCDDQHIIALVSVSRARVVASDDKRADKYLKDKSLYVAGVKRPSIYRDASHRRLLSKLPKQTV